MPPVKLKPVQKFLKDFNWFSFNGRFFYGEITFGHVNKKSEPDEKEYWLYNNYPFTYDDYPDFFRREKDSGQKKTPFLKNSAL